MRSPPRQLIPHRFWVIGLICLILVGVSWRFINLDRKVYWHDEVYTSMRAAGFDRAEVDPTLFQNRIIASGDLQRFQRIKPGSTPLDTVNSLMREDPQHPPLYFLMARFWMQLWGSSITASRLLPALLSLLAFPCIYYLSQELFATPWAAGLAVALIALSPFDVLFAQTARQYGLLTVAAIASSWLLMRALRLSQVRPSLLTPVTIGQIWRPWLMYALVNLLGFYTHPFFVMTPIAHSVYVLLLWLSRDRPDRGSSSKLAREQIGTPIRVDRRISLTFGFSLGLTLLLCVPWIWVLANNYRRALAVTDWVQVTTGFDFLVKLWVLSFTALFIDIDFGFQNPLTFLLRLPFAIFIGIALYQTWRQTPRSTWLLIFTTLLVPFLLLAVPDLVLGGKRSAISRYLIPCFPAVQLAVAFWLSGLASSAADRIFNRAHRPLLRQVALVMIAVASIVSCGISANADTAWNRNPSHTNPWAARMIKAEPNPIIISDQGNAFTNMGELISLSYLLPPDTPMLLLGEQPNLTPNLPILRRSTPLAFQPSQKLFEELARQPFTLEPLMPEAILFRLKRR
jgi:uncharacterized membrane protein